MDKQESEEDGTDLSTSLRILMMVTGEMLCATKSCEKR
jgi:hypothetical protein